jgi:putative ABC transport system permease protein
MSRLGLLNHYALTLYRVLTRQRLYAALNILGLAVGIAVFLVLTLFVQFQTSFERWIPGARRIYIVRTTVHEPGVPVFTEQTSMGGMLAELRADFPQIVGVRMTQTTAVVRRGDQSTPQSVQLVDPSFFDVFDVPLVWGDRHNALADRSGLVVTKTVARQYFGNGSPIGRELQIIINGQPHLQRVTAVMRDPPPNTDQDFGVIMPTFDKPTDYHWGSNGAVTFLKLRDSQAAKALNNALDRFVDSHARTDMAAIGIFGEAHRFLEERATPLLSMHLIDPKDSTVVITLGAVGLLTLLIAALNYVNIATARAALRAREVAVRKVLGGTRTALAVQFMGESIAVVALAAVLALAITEIALPLVNALGGTSLRLQYFDRDSVLPIIALTVVLVGAGSGLYPALVLSHFQPAAVLSAARSPGGGRAAARVREGLVVFQFAVAVTIMVCTTVLLAQTRYVQRAPLGFGRTGLVLTASVSSSTLSSSQRTSLMDAFRALPGVVDATESDSAPGDDTQDNESLVARPGRPQTGVNQVMTGTDYFTTYRARRLAGRWLDVQHGPDQSTGPTSYATADGQSVVINARAVSALGFASPTAAVGQIIRRVVPAPSQAYTIVGVVDDLLFHSPRSGVKPTLYFLRGRAPDTAYSIAAIRYEGADPKRIIAEMHDAWRRIAPGTPLETTTVDQNLATYYRPDEERSRLFAIGAGVAVLIACAGLFGLASFAAARRAREIGIRKTLGASTSDVLKLLLGQILRPVLIANLIAWPVAWVAMRSWLAGFDQRIALSPFYFLTASMLALAVASLTVIAQSLSLARAEPAKALRHE